MEATDLAIKHKQERKELQAKAQKIKHAVPKGDKKRLKETKQEIAKLEMELDAKHQQELQEQELKDSTAAVTLEEKNLLCGGKVGAVENTVGKKSKAAKRREKKEKEQKEREMRLEEAAIKNLTAPRQIEHALICEKLIHKNLRLYEIASDGDCLYNAVIHQLSIQPGERVMLTVSEVRSKVASELRQNREEYLPYLTTNDGEILDEEGFCEYCTRLELTHEWGGQVEIKALTAILKRSILIIQAESQDILIEPDCHTQDNPATPLTLIYHKKLYELGEHYNSVTPLAQEYN